MNPKTSFEQVPPTEATITCISCGRSFGFSQTVEGRCLRDHAIHVERERDKFTQQNARQASSSPTIAISNNNNVSSSASASASAYGGGVPMIYSFQQPQRRWWCRPCTWKFLIAALCILLIAGGVVTGVLKSKQGDNNSSSMLTTTAAYTRPSFSTNMTTRRV
jgi:hypothetical protein